MTPSHRMWLSQMHTSGTILTALATRAWLLLTQFCNQLPFFEPKSIAKGNSVVAP